ncbi:MAG TPA: DUF2721 domain-containing protein [Holophagaceae bacterium]|nr:DUF2721 domain-containing protein [Holophagaceae bacterium]
MPLRDLIPVLQVAIGPVILISGVGLLLLSMTNRYARIIDRTRQLGVEMRSATGRERDNDRAQLRILLEQARLLRAAMALAGTSVLLASLLVITIFLGALLDLSSTGVVVALFVSCLLCLIASLYLFLRDINHSLQALRLEVGPLDGGA